MGVVLYAGFGVLDLVRTRLLNRIGVKIERELRPRVFDRMLLLPLRVRQGSDGLQPVRDLDQICGFLSGAGPTALFDLPWMPFYRGVVYFRHPWLGLLGLASGLQRSNTGDWGQLRRLTEVQSWSARPPIPGVNADVACLQPHAPCGLAKCKGSAFINARRWRPPPPVAVS